MSAWQVQDAKSRFSEFLDAAIKKGPQIIIRRGIETAVLVSTCGMEASAEGRPTKSQGFASGSGSPL